MVPTPPASAHARAVSFRPLWFPNVPSAFAHAAGAASDSLALPPVWLRSAETSSGTAPAPTTASHSCY